MKTWARLIERLCYFWFLSCPSPNEYIGTCSLKIWDILIHTILESTINSNCADMVCGTTSGGLIAYTTTIGSIRQYDKSNSGNPENNRIQCIELASDDTKMVWYPTNCCLLMRSAPITGDERFPKAGSGKIACSFSLGHCPSPPFQKLTE
jgi:hypothetical protein